MHHELRKVDSGMRLRKCWYKSTRLGLRKDSHTHKFLHEKSYINTSRPLCGQFSGLLFGDGTTHSGIAFRMLLKKMSKTGLKSLLQTIGTYRRCHLFLFVFSKKRFCMRNCNHCRNILLANTLHILLLHSTVRESCESSALHRSSTDQFLDTGTYTT